MQVRNQVFGPGFFMPADCLPYRVYGRRVSKIYNCLLRRVNSLYSVYSRLQGWLGRLNELSAYISLFLFDIFYVFARLRDLDGRVRLPVMNGHNKNL